MIEIFATTDFSSVTDMLMDLLPVIIVISVFGAIIGMVSKIKLG